MPKYEYLSAPLDGIINISQQIKAQKVREKDHYQKIVGYYLGKIVLQAFEKNYINHFVKWMEG